MRRTRARGFALTTAAATLVSVSALAQGQSGQTGSVGDGIIAGRVVDAVTGRPVAGATVTLGWVSAEAAASSTPVVPTRVRPGSARPGVQVTDDTGWFEYAGLTAGRFRLQVRGGPGYRWSYFGMQTPWDTATGSTQHELRSNERLTDVVLKLWPGGSISGTVRDEFGEPVVKASLRLFERQTGPAVSGWGRTTVSAETDDRGQYRLGDRPLTGFVGTGPSTLAGPGPGDYIISSPRRDRVRARSRHSRVRCSRRELDRSQAHRSSPLASASIGAATTSSCPRRAGRAGVRCAAASSTAAYCGSRFHSASCRPRRRMS